MKPVKPLLAALLGAALVVSGCGSDSSSTTPETTQPKETTSQAAETTPAQTTEAAASEITVENCGEQKTYKPVTKLFANDGNIISIALAAGAEKQLTAVSSLERDRDIIALRFGDGVNKLNMVAGKYPTLENIVAADPEVVFAGWNYGFSEQKNITPDGLKEKGIESYILSESCRQADGKRGVMDPWEALVVDIENIGKITGNDEVAAKAVADIKERRAKLEAAPKAEKTPVAFLFDSASDTIFSSGSFGAPQAMMDSAGVKNALEDVKDTWTKISWERLAAADPDIIFFVDYPPQTLEEKIQALESNPASKNLTAVKEKRFVNLPYAMWTSGPLNIDGAEWIRKSLEHFKLQPESGIQPQLDIKQLDSLPGNEWLRSN